MKRFLPGLFTGLLIGLMLATASMAIAGQAIKLIVNGQEIACDVSPQNINGRVLVPARFVAESLGATVEWDSANNAVVITNGITPVKSEIKETTFEGMSAIEKNGQVYFYAAEYYHLISAKNINNNILYDATTNTETLIINGTTTIIDLANPESALQYHGAYYWSTKYYQIY